MCPSEMPKDDKHRKLKAKRENIESYLKINKIFIKKKKKLKKGSSTSI